MTPKSQWPTKISVSFLKLMFTWVCKHYVSYDSAHNTLIWWTCLNKQSPSVTLQSSDQEERETWWISKSLIKLYLENIMHYSYQHFITQNTSHAASKLKGQGCIIVLRENEVIVNNAVCHTYLNSCMNHICKLDSFLLWHNRNALNIISEFENVIKW